jgi:hypothetical protein
MVQTALINSIKAEVTQLIQDYGSQVTITVPGAKTYDEYGQPVYASGTSRTVRGVIDQNVTSRFNIQSAGKIGKGEILLLFDGNEVINKNDTFSFNGLNYKARTIENIGAADIKVVTQVIAAEAYLNGD